MIQVYKQIKYLIFDLDGTLLNSQNEISPETLKMVRNMRDMYTIIIASGRHYEDIKQYVRQLDLKDNVQIICCDGQYIVDYEGAVIWEATFLNRNDLLYFCRKNPGKKIYYYTALHDYEIVYGLKAVLKNLKYNLRNKRFRYRSERTISVNEKIEKIAIMDLQNSEECLNKYTINHLASGRSEILPLNVNKFNALSQIIEKDEMDSVLYFGDDANDIECFKNFKYSVSMGNALEEIKEKAYYVTESNDNDGVKKVLEWMLKGEI